jgi:hypothetical protein
VNETVNCLVCTRELWEDELGRYACRPCERQLADNLAALAGPGGLYARLCLRIQPATHSAGPSVSGSRSAPIPASLAVLDLTANGGLVSILEEWVAAWAAHGLATIGAGGRLQYRVDRAVATLRLNLPQAVTRYDAIDEFATELRRIHGQCEYHVNGRGPSEFKVQCACGHVIRATLETDHATCRSCDRQYDKAALIRLPILDRAAA